VRTRRALIISTWLAVVAAAGWVIAGAQYRSDLTAFLPAKPTALERLLVDQLRDGPASRLVLIALEGSDVGTRAAVAKGMAQRMRREATFAAVEDGERPFADADRAFLFNHRYLLSDAVTPEHFSVNGLRHAIFETLSGLATSTGLLAKSLMPHDPTGEMLHLIDVLGHIQGPRTEDGVWVSADGARTLLTAQTVASGSDTDAQEHALEAIRAAFAASLAAAGAGAAADAAAGAGAPSVRLRLSGPGVFAVAARAKIKRAATRLSIVSSLLVVAVLLTVYRSIPALVLGLLPVITGALCGIAAVALGFGAVHGVTLGFGITLIGESVDYSVYFFIQSRRAPSPSADSWQRRLWPTIRLGMLTSVCGFASLLPSGFPGLAQLGLYSISGLVAAAGVTRYVLPELLPRGLVIRDLTPFGRWLDHRLRWLRRFGGGAVAAAAALLGVGTLCLLYLERGTLWNPELAALSPIAAADLDYDARLRADLGVADVMDLVIVEAPTLEAALQGAERAGTVLQTLVDAGVIGDVDSPADFLPSEATQRRRRDALPGRQELVRTLKDASAGLDLADDLLGPFVDDVDAARRAPLLEVQDLQGTSLALGLGALVLHGAERWSALLPLHAPSGDAPPHIDVGRVATALAAARLLDTHLLDVKAQTDALYRNYLGEATRLSLCGFALIALLLLIATRSPRRTALVLAPLVLAVLVVAAALALGGVRLTLLHLVGMLLIVAVGSNYALFFDREGCAPADGEFPLTLASLCIANLSTVIGFGLLSFSQVPVLEALGVTVAPGAWLALLFSALLTPHPPNDNWGSR
jgi:predicted exporter